MNVALPPFVRIDKLDVALRIGGKRILRSVSLDLHRGEIHGLVGESGAGKSMLGKAILNLLPMAAAITGGTIHIDGMALAQAKPAAQRRFIGARTAIIPQDPLTALNPSRRIGTQITDRLIHILRRPRHEAISRARALLEEVRIHDPDRVLNAYPHQLSGGMRQRVLIAAAFAAEPDLIIADEPTTALDATVQKEILRLILALRERRRTTLLFVTHDMSVVANLCQSATVLYAGMVVEQCDLATLFASPDGAAKLFPDGAARAFPDGTARAIHPYARALIAATPHYDNPQRSLAPVSAAVLAQLDAAIVAADQHHASTR